MIRLLNDDALAKNRERTFCVIPAEAGIQGKKAILDPGFHRGDSFDGSLRSGQSWNAPKSWSYPCFGVLQPPTGDLQPATCAVDEKV